LNPRLPPCESKTYGSGDSLCSDAIHCGEFELDKRVDWEAFRTWLYKEFMPKTAYGRFQYAKQYCHCLLDKDFKPLLELSQDKRAHVMNSLSALSKFLGIHDQFSALVKNYGLKWTIRSDDLIIARFTKSVDPNDVFNWIKLVKASCLDLCDFMDFMATTGMRYEESVESYNLIVKLSREGKLDQYYDCDREVLEHFRFKEIFLRRTKKAFISFVPKELIESINDNKPLNVYSIQTKVKRKTDQLRFGDIREVHGTLLTKHLNEVEINFLHGRVGSSVFMRNYFNPAWISDLKERTFKAVSSIIQRIS
jgi:hypothetical protein